MGQMLLLCGLTLVCSVCAVSQAPDTVWSMAYGDSSYDHGEGIMEKPGGGFVVCGSWGTQLAPNAHTTDVWIFQTNSEGSMTGSDIYGGISAESVISTSDGGFMVLATTFSDQGGTWEDLFLLKLNEVGDTAWTHLIKPLTHDEGTEIHEVSDSGYLVLYYHFGESVGAGVYRTDPLGIPLWNKDYGCCRGSLIVTQDNGFILMGQNDSTWVLKADHEGNIEWRKSFYGEFRGKQILESINQEYLIIGQTYPGGLYPPQDIGIMRINNMGDSLSLATYPVGNSPTLLGRATRTRSQGTIISGATAAGGIAEDGLIFQVDSIGDVEWMRVIGGAGSDNIAETREASDGGFIAVGSTASVGAGRSDSWLLKFSPVSAISNESGGAVPSVYLLSQNYPNPFNPLTTIVYTLPKTSQVRLEVYNILGDRVSILKEGVQGAGYHNVVFDGRNLASGVYFYRLQAGVFHETRKLMLLK